MKLWTRPPGSPPRVRGKDLCDVVLGQKAGITPRVCGEKLPGCAVTLAGTGSPPRMRGKVVQLCGHAQNMGITPACAGKSLQCSKEFLRFWDHPRVCGEKFAT